MTHERSGMSTAPEIAHYERKPFLDPREKLGEMRATLANLRAKQAETEKGEAFEREREAAVGEMTIEGFTAVLDQCTGMWAEDKSLLDKALFRNSVLPLYRRWQAENWMPRFDRIAGRILPRNKEWHGALSWATVLRINDHLHKRVRRPPFIAACGAAAAKYKNQQSKSSYAIGTEASLLVSEIALLSDARYVERLRAEHEEVEDRNAERWRREHAHRVEQAAKVVEDRAKAARRWAKDILAAEREGRDLPAERRE